MGICDNTAEVIIMHKEEAPSSESTKRMPIGKTLQAQIQMNRGEKAAGKAHHHLYATSIQGLSYGATQRETNQSRLGSVDLKAWEPDHLGSSIVTFAKPPGFCYQNSGTLVLKHGH